ncbi:MAG: hypothetical protein KQI81_05500 [Deltaproteobacteria bacterium]|nr:hypothetical protein [Deltaproteobacteria bacterium]
MKKSRGRLFLIFAMVMSVVVVQNVFAETVEGTIDSITTKPNTISIIDDALELTVINGVKINYLSNQYNIDLEEGMFVSVDYDEFTCSDGSIKNMATSITVGEVTVQLR